MFFHGVNGCDRNQRQGRWGGNEIYRLEPPRKVLPAMAMSLCSLVNTTLLVSVRRQLHPHRSAAAHPMVIESSSRIRLWLFYCVLAYLLAAGRLFRPLCKRNCRGCAILPQALKHIRDIGFGQMDDEAREEENRR
jgi:hypothetical protein